MPETYAPILLLHKAQRLRRTTGDTRYHAPLEKAQQKTFGSRLEQTLARPFKILFQEPMLIATTTYMSFVYGCVYLLFEAYPVVFSVGHGFNAGSLGLTFLPLVAGSILGVILYLMVFHPRYEALMARHAPLPVPPEARLELAMCGAPVFAAGFFWFGWTSFPAVSFWAPMMSGVFMGSRRFGFFWRCLIISSMCTSSQQRPRSQRTPSCAAPPAPASPCSRRRCTTRWIRAGRRRSWGALRASCCPSRSSSAGTARR
ncbi:Polyamine transporter 1 [Grifola frondosa]|uniref:Polyamine transporter 1 n=1 Tax=Grifola frondosa TaxID=5627 RepID=A0A1C7MN02_GRIFR|nr:Polyamine transporter 1 [Grifola frondosa]